MDEWKLNKLEVINSEQSNIILYNNELKTIEILFNDLLRKSTINEREMKMNEILNSKILNNNKYKMYSNINLLQKYINNNIKLINITFENKIININKLKLFGEINNNIKNNLFNIPKIELNKIIKTNQNENGYNISLEWELLNDLNEEYKSNDFNIKYKIHNKINWNILNNTNNISKIKNNKYLLNILNQFQFDKNYEFQIQFIIQKPLHFIIKSNSKNIKINKPIYVPLFNLDMSKEENILLNIHSHNGHYNEYYKPENILNSDNNKYYTSKTYQITNDWIIFDIKDNNIYYPTKIETKTDGNTYAPKTFEIYIGNVNRNEWIKLNENIFTTANGNSNMQTFNFDIINNNNKSINNRIVKKRISIQQKNYKQFKLFIFDNYGDQYWITIKEFKIFGVKI